MEPHLHTTLARKAIRYYLDTGISMPCPKDLPDELREKKGAFVSLKKAGQLRGCIGSLTPTQDNLAQEIIHNAVNAATRDPRFEPVFAEELGEIHLSIDVLSPLEKVHSLDDLDCHRFGLAVKHGDKQGVLLPDLEGVVSIQDQLHICLKKAGIDPLAPFEMYRFEAQRYH